MRGGKKLFIRLPFPTPSLFLSAVRPYVVLRVFDSPFPRLPSKATEKVRVEGKEKRKQSVLAIERAGNVLLLRLVGRSLLVHVYVEELFRKREGQSCHLQMFAVLMSLTGTEPLLGVPLVCLLQGRGGYLNHHAIQISSRLPIRKILL